MKKSLVFLFAFYLIISGSLSAQGILKKVSKSMGDELLGKSGNNSNTTSNQPEPPSACEKSDLIMDMGGKLQLDYRELSISISNDGKVLAKHIGSDEYYIVNNGVTQGPIKGNDPRVRGFEIASNEVPEGADPWTFKYKEYITKKDGKYIISFSGKTYGPYDQIHNFAVSIPKSKFAALVIENAIFNEDEGDEMGEAMEKAMENAKTDQERMELAMKFSQQIQDKMMMGGGTEAMRPKLITNVEGGTYDAIKTGGGALTGTMKYDEIVVHSYSGVFDLKGNKIISVTPEHAGREILISSDNSKYGSFGYGEIAFSDNTKLSELFNPRLIKSEGKIFLAYMYYSPKKNSILQCKIPF